MRKWILWIPVLMVGSMVYWTIALNFGNLSLMALSTYAVGEYMDEGRDLRDSYQPITVQIPGTEEANAVPADDDEQVVVDVVSEHEQLERVRSEQRRAADPHGSPDTGPGKTAF